MTSVNDNKTWRPDFTWQSYCSAPAGTKPEDWPGSYLPMECCIEDLRAYAEQRDKRVGELRAERDSYKSAVELAVESQNQAQSDAERAEKWVGELEEELRRSRIVNKKLARDMAALRDGPISQPVGAVVADEAPIKDAIRTAYMQGYDDGKADSKNNSGCSHYNPTRIDWKMTQGVVAALAAQTAAPQEDATLPGEFTTAEALFDAMGVSSVQTAAPGVKPYGYAYECVQPFTDRKKWCEFFSRDLVEADKNTRNVIPLYTAPSAPLDISGLTRYLAGELDKDHMVYKPSDVQALIDAQKGKQ